MKKVEFFKLLIDGMVCSQLIFCPIITASADSSAASTTASTTDSTTPSTTASSASNNSKPPASVGASALELILPSDLVKLASLEQGHDITTQKAIKEFEFVQEALETRQYRKLENLQILDPHLILDQKLRVYRDGHVEEINLVDSQRDPESFTIDASKWIIKDGVLTHQGFYNRELIVEQLFPSFKAHSVIADKELVVTTTEDGQIYAADMGYFVEKPFGGIQPLFQVLRTRTKTPLFEKPDNSIIAGAKEAFKRPVKPLNLEFIYPGRPPPGFRASYTEDQDRPEFEPQLSLTEEFQSVFDARFATNIPQDMQGNPLVKVHDVMVTDPERDNLFFILSRSAIFENIKAGTLELAKRVFMMNHEGYSSTFSEVFETYLRIDTKEDLQTPFEELQAQLKENSPENLDMETMNDTTPLNFFLRSLDRNELLRLLNRRKIVTSHEVRPREEFSLTTWLHYFEEIEKQAQKEKDLLQKQIQNRTPTHFIGRLNLINSHKLKKLQHLYNQIHQQVEERSYNAPAFLRARIMNTTTFAEELKPWYQHIDFKKIKTYGMKLSKVLLVAVGGAFTVEAISPSIIDGIVFLSSWFFHQTIPEVLLDQTAVLGYDYRYPLLTGVLKHLSWILMIHLAGMAIVPMMKITAAVTPSTSKLNYFLRKKIAEFKDLSTWQQIILVMARPFAKIFLPFYHGTFNVILGKQFLGSMRKGLNPLKHLNGNSPEGARLGLGQDDSFYLGINNPFLDAEKKNELFTRREEVQNKILSEKRQAQRFAWLLATVVTAETQNIDPATLLMVANGEIMENNLDKINNDPLLKKHWERLSYALNSALVEQMNKDPNRHFQNLEPSEITPFIKHAQDISEKIKSNRKVTLYLGDLKRKFNEIGRSMMMGFASFGLNQYNSLMHLTPNSLVADQTRGGFFSDQTLVTLINSLFSVRSKIDHPADLAYSPEGSAKHIYNLAMNTTNWVLSSGPRKALVFQSREAKKREHSYNPLTSELLRPNASTEEFLVGLRGWVSAVFSPRGNIGAYFINSYLASFITIQYALGLTATLRVVVGNMSPGDAVLGSIFYFSSSLLAFSWPWVVSTRGKQMETYRLSEPFLFYRSSAENITQALILHNEAEAISLARTLIQNLPLKYKERNQDFFSRLDPEALTTSQSLELADKIFIDPPVFNAPNPYLDFVTVFLFAGVVSTLLASVILKQSFSPELITWFNSGKWLLATLVALQISYLLSSEYLWNKVYTPNLEKFWEKYYVPISDKVKIFFGTAHVPRCEIIL